MNSVFFNDDIHIPDYRVLLYLWDREAGESKFLADISNIAISGIDIEKERNMPDSLEVTIEYTQFKNKLKYEGSQPENILMPFLTEVKIQRNFETVFSGTLFHMTLALGEVGNELLTLKCCSWGEHYEKRYVGETMVGTYPEIARQLVLAGQHEMNWFDNYAWEYSEDYFRGWIWSYTLDLARDLENKTAVAKQKRSERAEINKSVTANKKAARDEYQAADKSTTAKRDAAAAVRDNKLNYEEARLEVADAALEAAEKAQEEVQKLYDDNQYPGKPSELHWDGGVAIKSGQSIWTYSLQSGNSMATTESDLLNIPELSFIFWARSNTSSLQANLQISLHGDKDGDIGNQLNLLAVPVTGGGVWKKYVAVVPAKKITEKIRWLKLTANNCDLDISDLQLYTKPKDSDPYDLDIELGELDTQGHRFGTGRTRHYHRQNIKAALYNVAKLANTVGLDGLPDTFEYEFDENKKFNIKYRQGNNIADPAFAAVYPGVIKSLTLERGLEDIVNSNYAEGQEEKTLKDKEGNEYTQTKIWSDNYSSGPSMWRFGAMCDFKSYDSIHGYEDLDAAAGSDLNIFDEIQNIPEIEVDSNIYNLGNVFLGDTITVNVLTDPVFEFVNGSYRCYSMRVNVSKDSVETMQLTLVPPDIAALQLISFPKAYKHLQNDVKRLMVG